MYFIDNIQNHVKLNVTYNAQSRIHPHDTLTTAQCNQVLRNEAVHNKSCINVYNCKIRRHMNIVVFVH